ncbi:MAG: acyltransferase [Bacteriovoracaceae bacterium]|nr:acyltransferase [Bacteriovoracaceae bacterium]
MENKSSLTSLRFIAAYMVIGSHYFNFYPPYDYLDQIFGKGYLGVGFFFVLSGFVMALRYDKDIQRDEFKPKTFISHRLMRIVPAYYLSLLLSAPLLLKAIPNSAFLKNPSHLSFFVFSNLTFIQAYWPVNALIEDWNLPDWSLSVEMFFYLMFPIFSVKLLRKENHKNWLIFLYLICAGFYFLNLYLPTHVMFMGVKTRILWINSPLFRLSQFLLGNCLYKVYQSYTKQTNDHYKFIFFALFSCMFFLVPFPNYIIGMGNPFSLLAFAGLIFYSAVCDKGNGILNARPLVALGEASYALYILQVPLKVFFQQFYSKIFRLGDTMGFLYCGYISVTLIISSYFIYRYFELPIDQHLRGRKK